MLFQVYCCLDTTDTSERTRLSFKMLSIAKWSQPDFFRLARESGTGQFLTITISHYVEFARWCLQYKCVPFEEHGYCAMLHVLPVLSVRVAGSETHLSSTSRMKGMQASGEPEVLSVRAEKVKGSTAVPLLVAPDGRVLKDSWEIAEYSGFSPVEPELRKILDEEIGPLSRQLAYAFILKPIHRQATDEMFLLGQGWLWRFIWSLGIGYLFRNFLSKSLQTTNAVAVANSRMRLIKAFDKVTQILKDKKSPFLGGSLPGAADFALAALASPILGVKEYNLGKFSRTFDSVEKLDEDYCKEIAFWRSTEVGKHVIMMYSNFRSSTEK